VSIPKRLNPFCRLPNPREVWAWGMYDLANQSFQLLINTLLFSLFIQTVVVGDQVKGDRAWSMLFSIALIAVVIISPYAGALADARAWKRELLFASGVVGAALTAALALLAPGQLWLAALLYIPAAIACGLGENFLGSFLPEISTPKNVGFVSALGWSMSYVGALLLVAITAAAIYAFGWTERDTRPLFVFAGLWFFLGMVPSMFHLKERAQPSSEPGTLIVTQTFRRLVRSARETRRFRQLARFFVAAFVYSMGTLAVISFLGLIGKNLGFQLPQLMLFALVTSLAAGIAAALTAKFQDRLGHRRTISVFLGVWVASTGGLALSRMLDAPSWTFWIVAAGVGVALGGIGTSSRAMVGAFTPEDRAGEFFGLWGMIYKLAGVVGVTLFGQVSTAFATTETGQIVGLLMLAGFFLAGLGLLRFVNETEGVAAARGPELQTGAPTPAVSIPPPTPAV
jgi:UMF1 family MFS transporter